MRDGEYRLPLAQARTSSSLRAYLGSFDPNNICTNWIGDSGSSPDVGMPVPFSFNVDNGQTFVVVVSEVTPGRGVPCLYVHDNAGVNLRRRSFADANSYSYGNNNSYSYGYANGHSNSYAYTDSYANGHSNGDCDCDCVAAAYADAQAATHATSTPISSSV